MERMEAPHRMVGGLADSLANGAKGAISGVLGSVQNAGKSVMTGLDGPFHSVTGKEGPHRIVDRLADGAVNATTNLIEVGAIGTAQKLGEGVMKALDQPIEQLGTLPTMPKLLGKK